MKIISITQVRYKRNPIKTEVRKGEGFLFHYSHIFPKHWSGYNCTTTSAETPKLPYSDSSYKVG